MLVNSDINIKKVGFQFVLISVDFCIFSEHNGDFWKNDAIDWIWNAYEEFDELWKVVFKSLTKRRLGYGKLVFLVD